MAFAKRWLFARRMASWAELLRDMDRVKPRVLKDEAVGETGTVTVDVGVENVASRCVLSVAKG